MGQTIFYASLDEFCRTYFLSNRLVTPTGHADFTRRQEEENASLFEHLLLFDKVSFKVTGENIIVPHLISQLGQKTFEALIEQRCIGFTLWTPVITYLVRDIPGVMALQSGTQSSPAHSDPEASIELGLKWMRSPLPRKARRQLTQKLLHLYKVPPQNLSQNSVASTVSAFHSGKLDVLDFSTRGKDIRNLALSDRKALCVCATELLEYSYLIQNRMTSFSNPKYFSLFDESASRINTRTTIAADFNRLAKLEGFPDLKALYRELADPLQRLPRLRAKKSSMQFREWLFAAKALEGGSDITKDYVDSIADAKGFFETRRGKLTKSVAMTAIGAGLGIVIGGVEVALGGAVVGKVVEIGADWALDLADEFLISGLTKGWSPRMFFDNLRQLNKKIP